MFETLKERRQNYRENMPLVFAVTAALYYAYWGEYFHLALFEDDETEADFTTALQRTHEQYFKAIKAAEAGRLLELACGGGALSTWMAEHMHGEVVGVDISPAQLAYARRRVKKGKYSNLRFIEHDIMRIGDLPEPLFDAAIYLDAACYLPDKGAALKGIATTLRQGARLLLIDWCRPEEVTALENEMILEPFYRYWCIPEMETVERYERGFKAAGFRLIKVEDLSPRVGPNLERGYRAAIRAMADPATVRLMKTIAPNPIKHLTPVMQFAKDQFYAAVLAKVGFDAGLMRYVYFLVERS